MELLIHSQTSVVQPLKFGNGWVISSHTLLGMWLLILGFKLKTMWVKVKGVQKCVEYVVLTPITRTTELYSLCQLVTTPVESSPLEQNDRHFANDIFGCIFVNEKFCILIKFSLKFIPTGPITNIPALVQIVAWRRPGDKPLSEPMLSRFTDAHMQYQGEMG